MACGEVPYKLNATDNPTVDDNHVRKNLTCDVQVYTTPPKCKYWSGSFAGYLSFVAMRSRLDLLEALFPALEKDASLQAVRGMRDPNLLQIYNIRSHRFTIVVGTVETEKMGLVTYVFTLLANAEQVDSVTAPTMLFISLTTDNSSVNTKASNMYLVIPQITEQQQLEVDFITGKRRVMQIYRMENISLNETCIDNLENMVASHFIKAKTTWSVICGHCVTPKSRIEQTHLQRPAQWRAIPDKEYIFLLMLFQNSSIIGNQSSFLGIAGKTFLFPSLESTLRKNILLFSPEDRKRGYHFTTCAGVEEVGLLTLKGLVSAFDSTTWICLICFSLFTYLIIKGIVVGSKSRDVFFLSLSILMEQGCRGNISRKSFWIAGTWLLVGVVVSNVYRGDNITAITAPLPRLKLEYFHQLLDQNFSYYMTLQSSLEILAIENHNKVIDTVLTSLDDMRLIIIKVDFLKYHPMLGNIRNPRKIAESVAGSANNFSNLTTIVRQTIWPNSASNAKNFTNLNFFIPFVEECTKAFVSSFRDATIMSQKLTRSLSEKGRDPQLVTTSKKPIGDVSYSLHLLHVPLPANYIFKRIQLVWSSGISGMWDDLSILSFTRAKSKEAAYALYKARLPKKLDLKGNTVVIFFIYLAILSMSFLILTVELRVLLLGWSKILLGKSKRGLRHLLRILRNLTCRDKLHRFRMITYHLPKH